MNEYMRRVNRVIDYIDKHLDRPLTVAELADVANFSPFHFHRIFTAIMREPLCRYLLRIRLEKAARQLLMDKRATVTEIALKCGFSSSAGFARSFKERFGMTASQWRRNPEVRLEDMVTQNSKIHQELSKFRKATFQVSTHFDRRQGKPTWRLIKMGEKSLEVEVRTEEIDDKPVAYVRYIGKYQGLEEVFGQMFGKLMQWACTRDLMREATWLLTLYHDDPSLTDEDKLRTSMCMTVPPDTEVEGEIGKTVVKGGRYAVGEFLLDTDEFPLAWKAMYGDWLPQSGYMPDDRPPFERYLNNPEEHPEHKHHFEIWMPIIPL